MTFSDTQEVGGTQLGSITIDGDKWNLFDGDYDSLTNKPTIPAAQVQSDYAQSNSSAVDYIKNKPDLSIYAQSANLATVATSGDYDDLIDKPTIPVMDGKTIILDDGEYKTAVGGYVEVTPGIDYTSIVLP